MSKREIQSVYLASPLGFAKGFRPYLEEVKEHLRDELTLFVKDPWEEDLEEKIETVITARSVEVMKGLSLGLGQDISRINANTLRMCDAVLGICDGAQIDDGTAMEMGFAKGLGKPVFGLRTDFRMVGDLPFHPVNVQVYHWIDKWFSHVEDIDFHGFWVTE